MSVLIWKNGLPHVASVPDRGFFFGDGLFETIRINSGKPVLVDGHIARLLRGCLALGLDVTELRIREQLNAFMQAAVREKSGVIKCVVTAGEGVFGYERRSPANIWTLFESVQLLQPSRCRLGVSPIPLADSFVLGGIKTLCRLDQALAASRMPDACDDVLMLSNSSEVIEALSANLLVQHAGSIITPPIRTCGIAGVMREWLMQEFAGLIREEVVSLPLLFSADALMLCNSVRGAWYAESLRYENQYRFYEVPRDDEPIAVIQRAAQGCCYA